MHCERNNRLGQVKSGKKYWADGTPVAGQQWLGRRMGRLTLAQLGSLAGGMDYAAVGQAVSRFGRRLGLEKDASLRREVQEIETQLSKVEGVLPKSLNFLSEC